MAVGDFFVVNFSANSESQIWEVALYWDFYLNDQNEQQYRGRPLLGTLNSFTKEGFQTNADKVALSANQILCPRAPSNLRAISKYQFEISSLDLSLTECNR